MQVRMVDETLRSRTRDDRAQQVRIERRQKTRHQISTRENQSAAKERCQQRKQSIPQPDRQPRRHQRGAGSTAVDAANGE
jgi:hypothetical protein